MSDFLKITTNTTAQIFARLANTASTLLVTLLVTHNLAKSDWGVFVTITSFAALFYLIVDFGLNGIVVRDIENKKGEIAHYFGNLLSLRIILSIFSILLALLVLAFTDHSSFVKVGIIIALSTLVSLSLFNTSLAVFQSKLRYSQAAYADILGAIATLSLSYIFVLSSFSIIFVVFAFVVGGFVRAATSLYFSKFYVESIRFKFDTVFWKYLVWSSAPIGLTLLLSQLVTNVDKQIIYLANYNSSLNVDNELAVGYYGLAYRIFEFGVILPAFFVNSVYPLMVRDFKKDLGKIKENFFRYGRILAGFGILATILVFVLSPYLVGFFGDYGSSVLPLRTLSLGYLLFYLTPLFMWTIISLGKEKLLPAIFGIAFLFNLAANLYFVPNFGFNSAAVITVVTEAIILIFLLIIISGTFLNKQNEGS